jgi:signal transduction histidine kinase
VQLGVLLLSIMVVRYEWPAPEGSEPITTARVGSSASTDLVLPDDWRQRPFQGRIETYDLSLPLQALPASPLGVMLPAVRMNAVVALNGRWLGPLASLDPPVPRAWRRPLVFALPTAELQVGENLVTVRVAASGDGRGFLAAPIVGPLATLSADADQRLLWLQTLPQITAAGMAAVAALMLLLWAMRRHETLYLAYGLGMLAWAAHNLNFFVRQPPLPTPAWETLAYLTLGAFVLATMFFIHRILEVRRPRIELGFTVFVLLGVPLFVLLPPTAGVWFGDHVWNAIVMGVGLYLMLYVQFEAWRRRSAELQLLAASGVVIVAFGVNDLLISRAVLVWGSGYMLHYAAAAPLLAFTGLLIVRFARSLGAVERMNEELHRQVQAATQEIEASHKRLRALERRRWLSNERERIAQDMHDGVGGQLLALLARARSGQLSQAQTEAMLGEAMADLRLVIDSLDVAEGDLGTAMAKFRHRLERRLEGSGIVLRWLPGELPVMPRFGPAEILHVLRLCDEAGTNVVRHANANKLSIEFYLTAGHFRLCLSDNGHGGAREITAGHGMRNMRRRAAQLGGTLEVQSGADGTSLVLKLPVDPGPPQA